MEKNPLKDLIIEEIRENGPIPFRRFMELALYHPEYGYYSGGKVRIGKNGDFYTSPHVHPLFGYTIARKFIEWAGDKEECFFLELGGGEGYFAMDFLKFIVEKSPGILKRMKYIIMEKSKPLAKLQREKLKDFAENIEWVAEPEEVPNSSLFIFANEFYDTFPVRRFVWEKSLYEIFVTEDGGELKEILFKVSENDSVWGIIGSKINELEDGQELEISEDTLHFTEALLKGRKGIFIAIDYGDTLENIIQRRRKSLRGFKGHRFVEDIYSSPGTYDITSNVCFTLLEIAGRRANWNVKALIPQGKFLIENHIYDLMNEYIADKNIFESVKTKLAVNTLVNPALMGETFLVMIMEGH